MDSEFWRAVGRLKGLYRRVSLADCCAFVLANRLGASLVKSISFADAKGFTVLAVLDYNMITTLFFLTSPSF